MLLLFSGLICWTLAFGGYDIIALGVMVMVLYLLVERFCLDPGKAGRIGPASLAVAVAVGLFATARIVFPILAPLFGLLIWKHNRWHAIVFVLVSLAVTACVHAAGYVQPGGYDPFHLVERAEARMGQAFMLVGGAVTTTICIAAMVWMKPERLSQLSWFTAALSAPFVFIAFGELIDGKYDMETWEGGNYLVPAAAIAILWALTQADAVASIRPSRVSSSKRET
jgi:hypothetical protein